MKEEFKVMCNSEDLVGYIPTLVGESRERTSIVKLQRRTEQVTAKL
jgi:hypothetical protein